MFNISESERKVLIIWIIIAVIIVSIVMVVQIMFGGFTKDDGSGITAKDSRVVNDRNRYYTVKGALTKYYSFVNAKDYDSVLKILDEKYVDDNKITVDNVDEKINIEDYQLSYETRVMCLKSAKKGVYTFVVDGIEVKMMSGEELDRKYYEIVMDGNTSLFSVKPINVDKYEEVCNGKN